MKTASLNSFSRAGLLAFTLFSGLVAGTALGAGFEGRLGLQLYSLRDEFKQDAPATFGEVQKLGFKYAEMGGTYIHLPPDQIKAQLAAHGIELISMQFPYDRIRTNIEEVAREASAMGVKYVGCPMISHQGSFDEKTCREAIAIFNHAGEILARHGLKFFYHPHGFEFVPYGQKTLLDLLISETNPKFVNYEMDIFWVTYPGQDPVKWLKKYGSRWELMHLKDMKKGTPTGPNAPHPDVSADVALGEGQMDIPAILRAAQDVGVKWYFIEDESPSSEDQVPVSLQFMKQVKL